MPTLAQQRLAALSAWFDRNSRSGTTPNGGEMAVGQYAAIVPCSFAEAPPIIAHHPDALPFYVSAEQSVGITFADFAPGPPPSQRQSDERLDHCLFLWGDGRLPPCIVISVAPGEAPQAALERAGLAGADLDAVPVLATVLEPLAPGPRSRLAARLPFVPRADAPDPDMPADRVFNFENRRDCWY